MVLARYNKHDRVVGALPAEGLEKCDGQICGVVGSAVEGSVENGDAARHHGWRGCWQLVRTQQRDGWIKMTRAARPTRNALSTHENAAAGAIARRLCALELSLKGTSGCNLRIDAGLVIASGLKWSVARGR